MSIGQVTIAQAAKGTWTALWKGSLWTLSMFFACFAFGVEWSWRVVAVCIVSSIFDTMIYGTTAISSGERK